ncbi:MAG: TIGR00725 family protein [Desulfovibrionales bacterium]
MDLRTCPRVSLIGAGRCGKSRYEQARILGGLLAQSGFTIICGGLGGIMEGAARGAQEHGGITVGILPGSNPLEANSYITFPLATGLGPMRNYLVVLNGEIVVAMGGAAGTLSEIGLALKINKTVIGLDEWAEIPGVVQAAGPDHVVELVKHYLL